MKDGFMTLPTDISSEVDLLKNKVLNALDSLEKFYKKVVKGKAQENVQKMFRKWAVLEAFEKALAEGLRQFEEEEKAEEDKKRLEEEHKIQAEEEV
ncbi:hypothetical protein A2U01_0045369 [Trifolium medium]|uniref:Uncharacterized protein n=1 Tax=Trifolium medium TaxID=97028 RepID=A0A392QKW4_9FABA|nr:hypothetical protein [Trifolium medium]